MKSFWAKKIGARRNKCILWWERVAKTMKREFSGTLSLFVPSPIRRLIDVDALDPAFSTDGFDGSRRISWQWIKCNLARLARPLDGSLGGGSLDPFYPHAFIRRAGENFRCKKTIQLDGLTFPGSARKVISRSRFIGMLLQLFSYIPCMQWGEGLQDSRRDYICGQIFPSCWD